jgi:hypothetical protein
MSFDYAGIASTATQLLAEMGQTVTHKLTSDAAYNPATGQSSPVVTTKARSGVVLEFGSGQTLVRGQLIAQYDKRLLLEPSAPVEPQDHFVIGSHEYVVLSVGEISPAGTVVMYDVHLHR